MYLRILFSVVLLFALCHIVRDILQIAGIENILTSVFHWEHTWCGKYCDYVSIPFELGAIVGATIVLQRNRIGVIGTLTLLFPVLLLFASLILK